jgi:flavin reductase (DIM6/NTAB) family NADH-FMN oxidoreductase RutF
MSERVSVELGKACRLMNHRPTVIVTSSHGGRANIMSAAWSMPLDFDPPAMPTSWPSMASVLSPGR